MAIPTLMPPASGIGLKPQHYESALARSPAGTSSSQARSDLRPGWVEVHPQNYFCAGGPPHRWLSEVARQYPLSFHSVGLSLGSAGGVDGMELARLAALCDRYSPALVSDHLSWSGSAGNRYPDLLPVPYTRECLDHFAVQTEIVQNRLARPILIENPSRYLAFRGDEMGEAEFLHELCRITGCGILLDINNIEVSASNLGLDPFAMLDAVDPALVGEVHLAGHAVEEHEDGRFLIDDHGSPVSDLTWRLFERFVARAGPRPVLVEWDTDVPDFEVLVAEAARADRIMSAVELGHAA